MPRTMSACPVETKGIWLINSASGTWTNAKASQVSARKAARESAARRVLLRVAAPGKVGASACWPNDESCMAVGHRVRGYRLCHLCSHRNVLPQAQQATNFTQIVVIGKQVRRADRPLR